MARPKVVWQCPQCEAIYNPSCCIECGEPCYWNSEGESTCPNHGYRPYHICDECGFKENI